MTYVALQLAYHFGSRDHHPYRRRPFVYNDRPGEPACHLAGRCKTTSTPPTSARVSGGSFRTSPYPKPRTVSLDDSLKLMGG